MASFNPPPLPKGFVPVQDDNSPPPLPKGFKPVDEKKASGAGSPLGYQPTPEDIKLKNSNDNLENSFDKLPNGSSPSLNGTPGFRQINPSLKTIPNENPLDALKRIKAQDKAPKTTPIDFKKPHQPIRLETKEERDRNAPKTVQLKYTDLSKADDILEAQQKAQDDALAKQREQQEKENPGSWSNALPELAHTVGETFADIGQFGTNVFRDLVSLDPLHPNEKKDLYQKDLWGADVYNEDGSRALSPYGKMADQNGKGDPLGSFILGLDAYKKSDEEDSQKNPLPHTFLGNTATGAIHIAPDIAAITMLPEASGGEAADLMDVLVGAAKNPFSKLQAAKGVIKGYNQDGLQGAISGGVEGEASGMQMSLLGEFGGKVVSPKIADALSKTGLIKDGKWSAIGADMLADATVFGAQPIASNLIQGKPINWNDVQSGIGTGLGFGMLKSLKTYKEHTNEEKKVKDILKDSQGIALNNFMNAAPEAIIQAYKSTDNTADLYAKATGMAHKTMQEPNIEKKKEYAATSSLLAKTAGVKATTEAILNDKDGFIKSIKESELPDEQKKQTIDKANQVHDEIKKADLGRQIQQKDADIAKFSEKSDDPVKNAENEVNLEQAEKDRDELNNNLKQIIKKQQDEKNDDSQKRGEESNQRHETENGQEENVSQKENVKPISDETDAKIKEFQKNFPEHHVDLMEDLPEHVVRTFDRVDNDLPTDPVAINEASDWLYNKYKELTKMKQSDTRMLTIPQIEAIQEQIGQDITALENHKLKYHGETDETKSEKPTDTGTVSESDKAEIRQEISPVDTFSPIHLSPEEHDEANSLLEEHGITTKDLENEQQERNGGSKETAPVNADEKGVQQPENDGTGNVGKTGSGEVSQGEKTKANEDEASALDIKSVSAARKVIGKEDIEKPESLNMDEEYRSAAKKVDNGTLHPLDIAREVIDKRRTPTVEEFHALLYHNAKVDADYEQAQKESEEAEKSGDPNRISESRNALIALSKAKDLLHEAARNVSYNWGFMGRMLQAAVKKDYSLTNLRRLFKAKADGEIPENIDALLKQYAKERDEAYKALQDYQNKEAERSAQREVNRSNRASIRNLKGEKLDKAIEDTFASISAKLQSQRGKLSMNPIPVEMLPDIGKLVGYYSQKGLLKAEEVAEKIFYRLKDDIDGLTKRDVIDAIAGNGYEHTQKTLDQLQKDKADIKRQAKLVARLDDIESGKVKPSIIRSKASISADAARLRDEIKKASIEHGLPLKNYKESLKKRLDDLETKIANKDYTKKPKQNRVQPDLEARKLQAKIKRAEGKIDELGATLDEKREHAVKKFLDGYTKVHRLFVLSRLGTLAKLTSAATGRAITAPLEEALGSINAVIPGFRKIAERSPRYSKGFNISDEVNAITQHFTKEQMKQNVQVLKEGKSDIDYLYDPKAYAQKGVVDLPGRIHAMFKNSTKMAEFNRSFSHILQWEKNNGSDINSQEVQERVGQEAYKLANRSIFMNDNMAVDLYKSVIDIAERKWGNTGTAVATVMRALMPIVKIPTNFALEATDIYTFGARALPTIVKAVAKGAESLSPKEADFVMRMLRKGEMGAAFMYIAYANPQMFGGYSIRGEKRDKKDLQPVDMMIAGVKMPHLLQHWPLIAAMQSAATLRRTQDYYDEKGKEGGTRAGILNGFKGIYENVPFFELPSELTKALDSDNATDSFVGQLIKNQAIPGFVQEVAEQTDTKDKSLVTINPDNVVKRKPDTKSGMLKAIKETVMAGIPGWREKIAERPESVDKSTPVIKLLNGTELKLNDKQIKERKQINDDYIAKHSAGLTKRFTTEAHASKAVKEKIKKLSSYWKEHNISPERQAKYTQMVIDDFVKKHIQEMAEKNSKPIMLIRYKKADGSYDFEKADGSDDSEKEE